MDVINETLRQDTAVHLTTVPTWTRLDVVSVACCWIFVLWLGSCLGEGHLCHVYT